MSKRATIGLVGLVCLLVGWIIGQHVPYAGAQGPKTKAPTWLHGLDLKARKGGEADFTDKTKKYGIEVFKDENNNNLVYISETGDIAVVPAR